MSCKYYVFKCANAHKMAFLVAGVNGCNISRVLICVLYPTQRYIMIFFHSFLLITLFDLFILILFLSYFYFILNYLCLFLLALKIDICLIISLFILLSLTLHNFLLHTAILVWHYKHTCNAYESQFEAKLFILQIKT